MKTILNKFNTLTLVLIASAATIPGQVRAQQSTGSGPITSQIVQTLSCGLWRTDGGFVSTIQLKNQLVTEPIDVTPVLYMADGAQYRLAALHLAAAGVATVNINQALNNPAAMLMQNVVEHASQTGSAALVFRSSHMAILGSVAIINPSASLSYTAPFAPRMAGPPSLQTLEGLWWRQDMGVGGFLALSNGTVRPITITLQTFGSKGAKMPAQSISLASHVTKLLDLDVLTLGLASGEDRTGGVQVQFDGNLGDVNVTGGLANDAEGYSALMPFWATRMSPGTAHSASPRLTAISDTGLMVGRPDSMMKFPEATKFVPYLALRNTTARQLDVSLTFYFGSGKSAKAPVQRLSPFQSKQVAMRQVLARTGLNNFNGIINLLISYPGQMADVIEAAGSVDETGTYVFEVLPKAAEQSLSKQSPYWSLNNGTDTMVTLWNASDKTEDIVMTLYFSGGHYNVPAHLDPHASANFDLMQLIASQSPDYDGNLFPPGVKEGSFTFASSKGLNVPIELNVNIGIFDVSTGTCYYGCITCDGYEYIYISPSTLDIPPNGSYAMSSYGYYDTGQNYSVGASWSSSNSAVASVTSDGTVSGEARGKATLTATAILPPYGQVCAYNPSCYVDQVDRNFTASGPANIGPDHLKVISDTNGVLCGGAGPVQRLVTYQIEYADNVNYTVANSVQESFSNLTNNTCGNGGPTPSPCTYTPSGSFTDQLDVTPDCFFGGSSCGFSFNQQWLSCSTDGKPVATNSNNVVHANAITIHGVTTPNKMAPGTMIYP